LDEFDVLDVAAEEQLPATAAARAFFPYLRRLMEGEPLLAFVFVVGRKAEDLSIDIKATFKAARYQRISVLDEDSARSLVGLAEAEGSLRFTTAAIDRVLRLTARHPYLTQLMCQLLFDLAYAALPSDIPTVDVSDVEAAVPRVLEPGENVFEWIWDGLPPAERVIFSAVAGATGENAVITEDELMSILQRHGIRILIRELELAPKTLIEWEMLRLADGGYGFFIELMRRWVVERKALPKVKDELDRVNPIADRHYQLGNDYYRLGNLQEAIEQLQAALQANPNHLKARLLVGETLREEGAIDEAVKELEEAYRYDEDAARYPLIRALLAQGERVEQLGCEDDALNIYQRVLDLSPREAVAREKLAEIHSIRRKRALQSMAAEVATLVQAEEWDKAAEVYGRLVELDPEDQRWSEGLKQVEQERGLARRYAEGLGAMQQSKWAEAQRAFADVIYERPTYEDAAELLASATRQGKSKPAAAEMRPNAWLGIFGRRSRQVAMIVAAVLLLFLLGFWAWVGIDKLFITHVEPPPGPSSPTPRILTGHTGVVYSVVFSPDGQLLASGSADQTIRLWKVGDGSLVRELKGHTRPVQSVAFSPDGQLLASGSNDQTVRLWKVGDGSLVRELKGHTEWVRSVAFSPHGQALASASSDLTVRLWSSPK
jgi:tetratricopeptide (TPR) repeat protein